MSSYDPILADIRFGLGPKPGLKPDGSLDQMFGRLQGPDTAAQQFPIDTFDRYRAKLLAKDMIGKASRKGSREDRQARVKQTRKHVRKDQLGWFKSTLSRRLDTQDGFRERLAFFWADHFTAIGKNGPLRFLNAPYVEEAIRPHVAGRFGDMLKAVMRQPLMLSYLDQLTSAGPNSRAAKNRKRLSGLNENLAREVLELHTLGVGAGYGQDDVRELAELLTGLSFDPEKGFVFRAAMAEPGPETVLGKRYGGGLKDIDAVLDDLALHPQTAQHIARKLAVHFVADTPNPDLIASMEAAYLRQDGALLPVYQAMLSHPAAWARAPANVKQPIDFVCTSLRVLGCSSDVIAALKPRDIMRGFVRPMGLMGQTWATPLGPDGWPEEDSAWVTPQRFAARMQWAMSVPAKLVQPLPDPRATVRSALGGRASDALVFAATNAEDRAAGIGVILTSPAFQRM